MGLLISKININGNRNIPEVENVVKIVNEKTPIIAVVHDLQIVNFELEPSETDIIVDYISTNQHFLPTNRKKKRPSGIYWNMLEKGMLEATPPLQELKILRKNNNL